MSLEPFDADTLQAIGALIALGQRHGIGVTFTPEGDGWTVGYLAGNQGGYFYSGDDLGEVARASLGEMEKLANEREEARLSRRARPRGTH